MLPLPMDGVPGFEAKLERTWWHHRSFAKRRDALMLGLALCGLRSVEVIGVRYKDLNRMDRTVFVRTAKKGAPRTVPVGESWMMGVAEMLRRVPRTAVGKADARSGALFFGRTGVSVGYEAVLRRCRQWTLSHFGQAFSVHCLRHTAAMRLYRATGDVLQVQKLLGHRNLQWTLTYLRSMDARYGEGLPSFVDGRGVRARLLLFDPDGLLKRGAN